MIGSFWNCIDFIFVWVIVSIDLLGFKVVKFCIFTVKTYEFIHHCELRLGTMLLQSWGSKAAKFSLYIDFFFHFEIWLVLEFGL